MIMVNNQASTEKLRKLEKKEKTQEAQWQHGKIATLTNKLYGNVYNSKMMMDREGKLQRLLRNTATLPQQMKFSTDLEDSSILPIINSLW